MLPNRAEIEAASAVVYRELRPTPQYCWPLLAQRLGAQVWVKHENHTPVGAFKIRGGLTYFHALAGAQGKVSGVISATRGNHGQSIGYAAKRYGIAATILVPKGNSLEKNAAMRALGVELVEYGEDFQAAREEAQRLAQEHQLLMVPSFHPWLIRGVATASMELLQAAPKVQTVYVPIGLGSGICAMAAARAALGHRAEIVGVVSAHAPAYALSFRNRRCLDAPVTTRLADGMACRTPEPEALDIIWQQVDRIVEVSDAEVAAAMRTIFECTHNVAEGAGAAAYAAAYQERDRIAGREIALMLSGGNVDRSMFASVLADEGHEIE